MKRSLVFATVFFVAVFVVVTISGCVHSPANPHYRRPKDREEHLLEYYWYPRGNIDARKQKIKERKQYSVYRIELTNVDDSSREAEPIRIDYYQAKRSGKLPTILMAPGYRGDTIFSPYIARYFACHGINVALVCRGAKAITEMEDVSAVEAFLKETVIRDRQIVDWLIQQEEVDQERLGSLGISLGAIKNVLTAGVEPRLKCHVFALAGGSLADVVCYSNLREIKSWRKRIMQKEHITLAQLHQDLSRNIKSDPITLGRCIDSRNVLMVIACHDRVIPRECAEKLRQAIGSPEAIYLPFGHVTSLLCLPYVKVKALEFFQKCFGTN